MRARFESEFERRLTKAARKHCDQIYSIGSWIGFWQFVYKGEVVFGLFDLYDKLVEDKKIAPFSDSIIDEHIGL